MVLQDPSCCESPALLQSRQPLCHGLQSGLHFLQLLELILDDVFHLFRFLQRSDGRHRTVACGSSPRRRDFHWGSRHVLILYQLHLLSLSSVSRADDFQGINGNLFGHVVTGGEAASAFLLVVKEDFQVFIWWLKTRKPRIQKLNYEIVWKMQKVNAMPNILLSINQAYDY